MNRIAKTVALAGLAALSCTAASTTLVGSWRDPAYQIRKVNSVLILAVTSDPTRRMVFETSFQNKFQAIGIQPVPGSAVLPVDTMPTREEVLKVVKERNIDLVLVGRLVNVKKEAAYVPPTTVMYAPPPGYYGFYPYYSYGYGVAYSPGYMAEWTTIQIETNVFSTATEKLVWSAVSKTVDATSPQEVTDSVAGAVIEGLIEGKVL